MTRLFRGSQVKLARALKLIAEVESGLAAYNADSPVSARWEQSGAEPALITYFKEIDPLVLAALGDAIHNMRSSLDLMACELVRLNNQSDKGVHFPFSASIEELPAAIKSKKFYLAGDDAVDLVTRLAPYRGGNERLRAIHDLDITDKHIALLITQRITKGFRWTYNLSQGPEPPVKVEFDEMEHNFLAPPLAGLPLIKTLKELVQLVDDILQAFANMVEVRGS